MHTLTLNRYETCLERCGYRGGLLKRDYRIGMDANGLRAPLAGFAHRPLDARSACVAVLTASGSPEEEVRRALPLGAPVVFVDLGDVFQWWKQGTRPQLQEQIESQQVERFFDERAADFAPQRIYRAKTLGAIQRDQQLDFVDVGLLPLVEGETGKKLGDLIAREVQDVQKALGAAANAPDANKSIFRYTFWLLAARILRDKGVPLFKDIDIRDVQSVFERVGAHYGQKSRIPLVNAAWKNALAGPAESVERFAHLGNVSTEALAYLYENTLVNKEVRKELAIHSTPPHLIDYIVWRLEPWIRELPRSKISAFEPACGHAGFLLAIARLLREIHCDMTDTARSRFIRKALRGVDIDSFALEIARLSLTLSDVPNPNGWNLDEADIFASEILSTGASEATILLMNPPYSNFTEREQSHYQHIGSALSYGDKALEAFKRALEALPSGAVFGIVGPQGILHKKGASELRRFLVRECELKEICLFPDRIFEFSDMETAVVIGRRTKAESRGTFRTTYRRVREGDVAQFKASYVVTSERELEQFSFEHGPLFNLRVADLDEIWEECKANPVLSNLAEVGQGFFFKGASTLGQGEMTVSNTTFPGAVPGFDRLDRDLSIHQLPRLRYLNLSESVIDRAVTGTTIQIPQIILNYAPVSRGPWRLKALLDREGRAVTSRFLTVRPKEADTPLEYLWALCNSPVSNAYVYAHSTKRDILAGQMRRMPVPHPSPNEVHLVLETVRAYFMACKDLDDPLSSGTDDDEARDLLLEIDALILRLYDLPPHLERQLLDLFAGHQRQGVPFPFERYYPEDFRPYIPLHVYLSEEYTRSTAGAFRQQWKPVKSKAVLTALKSAADAFSEE